jgi:nitronate monooxygenase/enoyl-[acyl-carrier protein] reductase II
MLHTRLCDVLQIEFPIIQAAIAPTTSPELVATVSNAGGMGSLGAAFLSAEALRKQVERVQELTQKPFAINHVIPLLNEEAFAYTLAARPPVISFALGDPGDLVQRAHAAGIRVIHQIHTVEQAHQAAQKGVDAIIAQGSEAGGMGGTISTMVLLPQVVDAVHPLPVIAAGGIADGRGLAAALVLGAQGANCGTRFLASKEAASDETWKQRILATTSQDIVKVEFWSDIFPSQAPGSYDVAPRAIRTSFIETWHQRRNEVKQHADRLRMDIMSAMGQNRAHELAPFTGQIAGAIHGILPAGEIVRNMAAEAEEVLKRTVANVAVV